jgi:hypothetical protein
VKNFITVQKVDWTIHNHFSLHRRFYHYDWTVALS